MWYAFWKISSFGMVNTRNMSFFLLFNSLSSLRHIFFISTRFVLLHWFVCPFGCLFSSFVFSPRNCESSQFECSSLWTLIQNTTRYIRFVSLVLFKQFVFTVWNIKALYELFSAHPHLFHSFFLYFFLSFYFLHLPFRTKWNMHWKKVLKLSIQ